jgi:hypothetical protein
MSTQNNNKISEEDLKTLKQVRDGWLNARYSERFRKGELDGLKLALYNKYDVSPDDYFIDGETGEIRKRNRDIRVRKE